MIISRTPYKLTLFGDETYYPSWYKQNVATLLSATINHYCYVQCRFLPPFFPHHSRLLSTAIEQVTDNRLFQHPLIQAVLGYMQLSQGVEIRHQEDLPAHAGVGSSSALAVGALHALYALQGMAISKQKLAVEARHIKANILKEAGCAHNQIATAYGGLNQIVTQPNGDFDVNPIPISPACSQALQDHLMLFYIKDVHHDVAHAYNDKIQSIQQHHQELARMDELTVQAIQTLTISHDLASLGELLHETWRLKKQINKKISTALIDEIYECGRTAGALGGKLLGNHGSSFMLFFVAPDKQAQVSAALAKLVPVAFNFDDSGSQIIFSEQKVYQASDLARRDYFHLQQFAEDRLDWEVSSKAKLTAAE